MTGLGFFSYLLLKVLQMFLRLASYDHAQVHVKKHDIKYPRQLLRTALVPYANKRTEEVALKAFILLPVFTSSAHLVLPLG